jgi:cupin 2 domain-containing protein
VAYRLDDGKRMYLGIDFSGDPRRWRARCSKPTVWIARIEDSAVPRLIDLHPVQNLRGVGEPFAKLVELLRTGDFAAAGIDAPFAIPARYLPLGGHVELLERVGRLSPEPDRPFASGESLIALAAETAPLDQLKPHRETERVWAKRGVNTRSTLWNKARGGAAFTAACLTLLARSGRPVWPWNCGPGMLVEAFPAAQLRTWALPYSGYSKPEQCSAREPIVAGLAKRLDFTVSQQDTMRECPDALDAVIAAFAAIAAVREGAPAEYPADGLIAVLDDGGSRRSDPVAAPPHNILHAERESGEREVFEEVLRRPGLRIERIISRGHTTPATEPYVQDWDEWVLVLTGSARLMLDGSGERSLAAGEHLLIPAGVPHLVTYTAEATIWLAIHIGKP